MKAVEHLPRDATAAPHYKAPPQRTEADGSPTWITRGDTFSVCLTEAREGAEISHSAPDEAMLIVPEGGTCEVEAGGETICAEGETLVILPPGPAMIRALVGGTLLRVLTTREGTVAGAAVNAAVYADAPDLGPPPAAAPGGFRLRLYDLVAHDPGGAALIRPRIFMCTTLMVNCFARFDALRPEDGLRPHSHEEFEQGSVALAGEWVHDLRTPWGNDLKLWREDQHLRLASPSTCIIPRRMIHSSRNLTEGAVLVDVFSPPRADFINAGVVCNAADYPHPTAAAEGDGLSHNVPHSWIKEDS